MTQSILEISNPREKLARLDDTIEFSLSGDFKATPFIPGRDIQVLDAKSHPPKKGLSFDEGQARLLHDLASIELQAMELGVRTLFNFPAAPTEFKDQLISVIKDEARHLELCLNGIESLGFQWGDWPIHTNLWTSTSDDDDFIDRLLIVHCYLEGSGLDAGDTLLRRLGSVNSKISEKVVQVISEEELGHVLFGTKWFADSCKEKDLDPDYEFKTRMNRLHQQLPMRRERINHSLRKQAGFSNSQIQTLEWHRQNQFVSQ